MARCYIAQLVVIVTGYVLDSSVTMYSNWLGVG